MVTIQYSEHLLTYFCLLNTVRSALLTKKRAAKLASISELIQPALYSAVYCAPVGKSSVNFLENDRFPVHIFRGLSWPFGNGNRRTQHSQSASPLLSSAPRRPIANAVLSGGLSALRP